MSFYSDYVAVLGTDDEVILSFFETRPGLPTPEGKVDSAEARRRAVIMMTPKHALRLARVLGKVEESTSE